MTETSAVMAKSNSGSILLVSDIERSLFVNWLSCFPTREGAGGAGD